MVEFEVFFILYFVIEDVVVIGVLDVEEGELLMVFVVCKVDVIFIEKDVYVFVDENVVVYKKLRGGVEFIDEILKLLSGKIFC